MPDTTTAPARGRLLLLLGACVFGAYYLVRSARELAQLDMDDLYDVWGDDPDTAFLPADTAHADYRGSATNG